MQFSGSSMQLDAERLRHACADRMAATGSDTQFRVDVLEEIGSTNHALMVEPFGPTPAAPRLMVVWRQTEGRGRRGRSWTSPPQVSLTFSLAFERPADAQPLAGWSIAAGLGIAAALAPQVADIALKWPNDLQRQGRKCGGILAETRRQPAGPASLERVVTGIGLNLLPDPQRDALAGQPTIALFDGEQLPLAREQVLAAIATQLWRTWLDFQRHGLAGCMQDWRRFDALIGREVKVLDNGQTQLTGRADGIDETGALRVIVDGDVVSVMVGDVSVRRVE